MATSTSPLPYSFWQTIRLWGGETALLNLTFNPTSSEKSTACKLYRIIITAKSGVSQNILMDGNNHNPVND